MAVLDYRGLTSLVSKIFSKTFGGASSSASGSTGVVPAPEVGDQNKFLKGDGTWAIPEESGDMLAETYDPDGAVAEHGGIPSYMRSNAPVYTAGENINISEENVISADNAVYTAGNNIQISNENVISATDTTYTAGANINISNENVISAHDTTYSAGAGISISEQNVISATGGGGATYTAGEGISISEDNVISATGTSGETYTAGENIQISNENVISATDTTYDSLEAVENGEDESLVTTGEKYEWNNKSDFSGDYNDLTNTPTLGTASALNVAESGDASTGEVVKGDDSRLTDARTPVSHTHTVQDVLDLIVPRNLPAQNDGQDESLVTTGEKYYWDSKSDFSGNYADLTGAPTLGTAAEFNVASSGDATFSQVVKGDDSRLTDARPASDVPAWAKEPTKPTYTPTEFGAVSTATIGAVNGVASLDSTGRVPSTQLPSYVDDVLEYANYSSLPSEGESGKLYVTLDTNKVYRWSGSTWISIDSGIALGETANTAYAGDKGKANADAISELQSLIPSSATDSNQIATQNDLGDKADKVGSATSGHFAGLDANGNLTDSGVSPSDFIASSSLGTAAELDVAVTGNASASQVVKGNDTRLTDARAPLSHSHLASDVTDLGTAATKNVPTSGNASSSQVVMGSDTRLTDSRTASDVYSWAKASTKPTYTASEVGAIPSTDKGANGGVATLGSDGKVPSSQLPSSSDSVVLTQTLIAGNTYVTFTDSTNIKSTAMYDVYTSKAGLNYTSIDDSVSGN